MIEQALLKGVYGFFVFCGFSACLGGLLLIVGLIMAVSTDDKEKKGK